MAIILIIMCICVIMWIISMAMKNSSNNNVMA
jgi:hypothetical protein